MTRTIILTGASDGIGAAAARKLVDHGHAVAVVGRSRQKTETLARELRAAHFLADFTKFDDVRKLADALQNAYP
jgi:short-subunit dehydrogenase